MTTFEQPGFRPPPQPGFEEPGSAGPSPAPPPMRWHQPRPPGPLPALRPTPSPFAQGVFVVLGAALLVLSCLVGIACAAPGVGPAEDSTAYLLGYYGAQVALTLGPLVAGAALLRKGISRRGGRPARL